MNRQYDDLPPVTGGQGRDGEELWAAAVWLGWLLPWAWLLWYAPLVRWFTGGLLLGGLCGFIATAIMSAGERE